MATIVACLAVTSIMFSGCKKDDVNNNQSSITIADPKDLTQTAWADDETTGKGFTFTAKSDWMASVKEVKTTKSSDVPWITLLCNGVETYSGSAGTFTIVISITPNTTGQTRTATIEILSGGDKITITVTQESKTQGGEEPSNEPVELKSPIRENTTLKNLGLEVDYFYAGNDYLIVENNATLTIEPDVTIQFTNTGKRGGMQIQAGATIKAIGTADKRIRFIGTNNDKGSWVGIQLESNTDNQFAYCDFLNAGSWDRTDQGAMNLIYGAKVGISHCKFTNGNGQGLFVNDYGGVCQISAFNNNVIEGFELAPVYIYTGNLKQLEKFDMTSNLSNNKKPYIDIRNPNMSENVTINGTTVPYNFLSTITLTNNLTINEGVTIYLGDNHSIVGSSALIMINGTAARKVRLTRMPSSDPHNWAYITFGVGSVVKHCIFEYGGKTGWGIIGIIDGTNLTLENVEINNSDTYGAGTGANNCNWIINHTNVTFSNNKLGNFWNRCPIPDVVMDHFP